MTGRYNDVEPIASPTTPNFPGGRPQSPTYRGEGGHHYPPSQSPTSSTDHHDPPYASRRPTSDRSESDNVAPPTLPRYTSHAPAAPGLSPLNPSSGRGGNHGRAGSNYGSSNAHPLSNSTFADSSPTLAEHPASSTSSFAEKKGYHRARTNERPHDEDAGYVSPSGRRREGNGVVGFYRRMNGDFIGDDGRDERHTKPPRLGYLEGLKFLSAIVALNGTLMDATLNESVRSSPLPPSSGAHLLAGLLGDPARLSSLHHEVRNIRYGCKWSTLTSPHRSFGLALSFFLVLTGRSLTAALWELPAAQRGNSSSTNKVRHAYLPDRSQANCSTVRSRRDALHLLASTYSRHAYPTMALPCTGRRRRGHPMGSRQ